MGVTSRTGIMSTIHKKGDKRDIENQIPISFLNIDFKIHTTCLKNWMQKPLDAIIGENQSEAF